MIIVKLIFYVVNINSGELVELRTLQITRGYPIWANSERTLFYTSDHNGVYNLYKYSFNENSNRDSDNKNNGPIAITNVLTGLQQPTISKDDKSIIFCWGILELVGTCMVLNNPLNMSR